MITKDELQQKLDQKYPYNFLNDNVIGLSLLEIIIMNIIFILGLIFIIIISNFALFLFVLGLIFWYICVIIIEIIESVYWVNWKIKRFVYKMVLENQIELNENLELKLSAQDQKEINELIDTKIANKINKELKLLLNNKVFGIAGIQKKELQLNTSKRRF